MGMPMGRQGQVPMGRQGQETKCLWVDRGKRQSAGYVACVPQDVPCHTSVSHLCLSSTTCALYKV